MDKRSSIIKIFNKSILLNLSILFLLSLFVVGTVLVVRQHQKTYMSEVNEKKNLKEIMVALDVLGETLKSKGELQDGLENFFSKYKKFYDKAMSEEDTEKQERIKVTIDIEVFLLVSDLKKIISLEDGINTNAIDDLYVKRFFNRTLIIKEYIGDEIRILEKIMSVKHYRLTQIQNMSIVVFIFLLLIVSIFILTNRKILLHNISAPLKKLSDGMNRIGCGDFKHKIEEFHNNELGDLCHTMNSLTENILRSHKQLTESHRLASIGVMASGIAHELSQPLGIILLKSQLVSVMLDKQNYSKAFSENKNIEVQIFRAKKIIDSLRVISREGKEELKSIVDLNDLANEVITIYHDELRFAGLELKVDLSHQKLNIYASHVQICQAISNVLSNAKDAVKETSDPEIKIKTYKDMDKVVISISDNGSGISEKHLKRIFEPFYTLKEVGKGTGLGLSLCNSMVKENDGEISVNSEEGNGAVFELIFPYVDGVSDE